MKILLAHNFYQQPGGEDAVFSMESTFLQKQGHQVFQYIIRNDALDTMNPLQTSMKALWNQQTYREVCQLIDAEAPDILHVHNTWPLLSPSIYHAANVKHLPVVQTLHNYRLFCPSSTHFYREEQICEDCLGKPFALPGIKYACYRGSRPQTFVLASSFALHRWIKTWQKRVDAYIALTDFARQKYIQGGLPIDRIYIKPNVVYSAPEGQRDQKGEYALFVGRLSKEKGVLNLLDAWRSIPNIPLKIIGDGPLFSAVQRRITEYPLENIEILGWQERDAVLKKMKQALFLIFPSEWYEGFPMTIAEAFACGVPVLASNLGAMAEILENGRTGLHFTPGDERDLAEKAKWIWQHPEEMRRMGVNARKEYEQKYTAEKNYKQLMYIYQQAIRNSKNKNENNK